MTNTRPAHRSSRRGFTLIEMLMVVVLISIVVTWAVPKFSVSRYRADAAGNLVRTLLQSAQRNSITRQSNLIVSFDQPGRRLRIVQDDNNNGLIDAGERIQYRNLEEGAKFATPLWPGPNGTTPASFLVGNNLVNIGGLPSINFLRDGSGSSDLEVYVTTRDNVKEEFRAVTLTGATGRTELWKYNGTAWMRMSR